MSNSERFLVVSWPDAVPRKAGRVRASRKKNKEIGRAIKPSEMTDDQVVQLIESAIEDRTSFAPVKGSILSLLRGGSLARELLDRFAGDPRKITSAVEEDFFANLRLEAAAHRSIFESEEFLTATAVSKLLGSRSTNLRVLAHSLREKGEILGVPHRNRWLFPAFQFDRGRRAVFPEVASVNRILGANSDPWGVASWWTTPNSALGGRAPKELIGHADAEARLVAAAEALIGATG